MTTTPKKRLILLVLAAAALAAGAYAWTHLRSTGPGEVPPHVRQAPGGDGERLFVHVIAFETYTVTALLALDAGDSIALAGSITPKVWTDREGQPRPALDMVAHQVLTTYHVTRKRRTVQAPHHGNERPGLDDGEPLDF